MNITPAVPSYSDAHVAHYAKLYRDRGMPPVQARRWAQSQVAIDWLEQVDILCSNTDEKIKLMDLGTKKIIDMGLLNRDNLKHHKMFVKRNKMHYIIPDEAREPQGEMECSKLLNIAVLTASTAVLGVSLAVHLWDLAALIW
jgi:hypothetical protein